MKGATLDLHRDLMDILMRLEAHMGFELTVTSGKRTGAHNDAVGGVPESEHTYEEAEGADVLCKQSITRFKMVKWLLFNDVRRIGIGNEFIHIGIADDKPQFVMWDYYPEKSVEV